MSCKTCVFDYSGSFTNSITSSHLIASKNYDIDETFFSSLLVFLFLDFVLRMALQQGNLTSETIKQIFGTDMLSEIYD